MATFHFLLVCVELFLAFPRISVASDTISPLQSLRDGDTLVSEGGTFELGFFSPGNSSIRYLGLWYKNIPVRRVVWVANRQKPINDSSGVLTVSGIGRLMLLSGAGDEASLIWSSSGSQNEPVNSPVAQLLESGNLVLRDQKDGNEPDRYLWQSFDYPSDTLLQGMRLGSDSKTGLNRNITSWKSADDPSPGELTYKVELNNYPETVVWKGSSKYFRSGPWNGIRFSGATGMIQNPVYDYTFVSTSSEVYYTYHLKSTSLISVLVVNETNDSRNRLIWVQAHQAWEVYSSAPRDNCDNYGLCGANGICIFTESPVCQCLHGFKPKSLERWGLMDWSQGCIRDKPLNCQKGDGFAKFEGVKLPDTSYTWLNTSMSLKECRAKCLSNCSCTAYTNSDIRGKGSGCAMWFGDLIDIRKSESGQELYIRMQGLGNRLKKKRAVISVVAVAIAIAVACGMLIIGYTVKRKILRGKSGKYQNNEGREGDFELPYYSLAAIIEATSNFSQNNKIGEGGFGSVYKGTLATGQVAMKRLSVTSRQGLNELKNEATLIAKLQHRNLVKLLGCCIEGEERILIYEYMPNKSLDYFIFDHTRGKLLGWPLRFHIICGISRGLLYLHQDSRLRIIHRDLKASNVLLDVDMNPKISDFGLARCFGSDEIASKTKRVIGTYGYMSPEYAIDGLFSVKSDVFSFGVLLLEIVSGERNRGFHHPSHNHNLIGHAWSLWEEGKPLELINSSYGDYDILKALRCIHIGLLCVQQRPEDRPNMSFVVPMLVSEGPLPRPRQPGFFVDRNPFEGADTSSSCGNKNNPSNEISITIIEGR